MLEKLKKELLEGLPEETFYNMDVEEYHQHIESVFSRVRVDREKIENVLTTYKTCNGKDLIQVFSEGGCSKAIGEIYDLINALSNLDFIEVGE